MAGLALGLGLGLASAQAQEPFVSGLAGFTVECQGQVLRYEVESVFILPGESVQLRFPDAESDSACVVRASAGAVNASPEGGFVWHPPLKPGVYSAELLAPGGAQPLTLRAFVLLPYDPLRSQKLNGYRIGRYPLEAWKGKVRYEAPRGWVEATPDLLDLRVSPHFRLGQFVCKQAGGLRRYLVLDSRLLRKLERLLAAVNEAGHDCQTLAVLSGYRTPVYNRRLGNAPYSGHLFGWAADVYVDADRNGWMDDVNQDGRSNLADAYWLFQLAENLDRAPEGADAVGGLGLYPTAAQHGPFVHVDVRGRPARWGLHRLRPRWAEKP